MSKRQWLLLGLTLFVVGMIIWRVTTFDNYYNPVPLSGNNTIINNTKYSYVDTVLSVGLDKMGIGGVTIMVDEVSEEMRNSFYEQNGVELGASIMGNRTQFLLHITPSERRSIIRVLSHELIHLGQYHSGRLVLTRNGLIWENQLMSVETMLDIPYGQREWEREAFDNEPTLGKYIDSVLY